MKKCFIWLALIPLLGACQWGEVNTDKADINMDTLVFKYDTIKNRAPDCGDKPDSLCTVALIIYPKFTAQNRLNDTIREKLLSLGFNNPDKARDTTLHQYAINFIDSYVKDDTKQYRPDMFYTMNLKAEILRQDSSLTTLQIQGYIYEGGAHGTSSTTYINWNTKAAQNIKLNDIFVEGYKGGLTAIADTIFRQQEKLSDTSSLARDYFFKDDKFALNENYSITPLGIKFLYNPYEIKPYAAGITTLFIPYNKIRSLLRPNTVIKQYYNTIY